MHTCPPKNLFQTARVILSCQIIPLLCSKPGCHLTQRESPSPDKGQASPGPNASLTSSFASITPHSTHWPLCYSFILLNTLHLRVFLPAGPSPIPLLPQQRLSQTSSSTFLSSMFNSTGPSLTTPAIDIQSTGLL